jgi:large repetitive protein
MRAKWLVGAALLSALLASPSQSATTYVYDNLGRLWTVTYDNGLQVVYSYDAAGNRTSVVRQTGTNRPPQANNDRISVTTSTPSTFNPLLNDTDPDGDTLTISAVGTPTHGSASKTATSVTYTPTTGYTGLDSFTYTISDSHSHTAQATIYASVVNGIPPIAVADFANTLVNTAVTFDPRLNDTEPNPPGNALTVASVTTPANGTAVVNSGTSVTYTPATNFEGTDNFIYTLSDGHGQSATAIDTVSVGTSPVAVNDYMPVPISTAYTFDPRYNDSDPNGFVLTIASTTTPAHGTIAINSGTALTYTPTSGYSGPDTFNYTISDGHGLSATATDTMCMGPNPPVANTDTIDIEMTVPSTTYVTPAGQTNVLTNDTDPCGGALTVTAATNGARGTVTVEANGIIGYVYGSAVRPIFRTTDSFTYTVTDSFGATATGTVNVTIDIQNSG